MLLETPTISAIVPTYNAGAFLPEALDSIRAQCCESLEIVVVDDGSTDNTRSLVESWHDIRYVHQANQGPSAARNTGIDVARGELLAFLDADDLWTPDHLAILWAALARNPQAHFAWGQSRVVQLNESPGAARTSEVLNESVPQFLIGSGLYRRSAFEIVGRFDPSLKLAEDIDWILTARGNQVPHVQLAETVLIYRKRAGSLTSGKGFAQLNVMSALKRSIQRHRMNQPAAKSA